MVIFEKYKYMKKQYKIGLNKKKALNKSAPFKMGFMTYSII